MGNRRVILFLLAGIAACALLLWVVQRRERFFPEESKVKAVLFEEPLDAVDNIAVERGETRMELRRQDGVWSLYAPFSSRVDQGAVTRLLDAFESARVSDALGFLDLRRRELSPKEFGLSPASVRVVLKGAQRTDEIRFGALSPLGKEVYARMNQLDQVLVLPASLCAVLPHSADDLRSRKLLHCDRALLRTIEIRTPGRPFIKLSKETGTWRLVQPAPGQASDEKVESLLDRLYDARITRFVWPTVSNVMDVAETDSALKARMELYGLGADAAVQIHMQESGASPSKLVFGRPLDDSDSLCYALLQGGDTIGAVSNDVPKAFDVTTADLRDTRLFFEKPDAVRRLQIGLGDQIFVLAQTNAVWQLQAPISDVADQRAVKDSVELLLRLKADRILDGVNAEVSSAGGEVSPPISHVELVSDQTALRFSISSDDYEGRYFRIAFTNAPTVFLVASSNVPPAFVGMIGLMGLRDKTVLSLPAESVRRITVRRANGECSMLQCEQGSSVWRLGEGVTGKVNGAHLGVWLSRVVMLRADRIEKLGLSLEDLDAYGLRSPWLEISLDVDVSDALRKTLLIGKDAGFGKRYAMVRGLDVLFVLDEETLRVLSSALVEPL
jgi:hypothetical protein